MLQQLLENNLILVIYVIVSLCLRVIHYLSNSKKLNNVIKRQRNHEELHKKKETLSEAIYKTLTKAYDFETKYHKVKNKTELSGFLYNKLRLLKGLAEFLCGLDYFSATTVEVNNEIDNVRDEIYNYAKNISVDFAQRNKKQNSGVFYTTRHSINEILNDNVRNDKQGRLLVVIKDAVSNSTRLSIKAYRSISTCKFTELIRENKLYEAACELLSKKKFTSQIIVVMSQLESLSDIEIKEGMEYEKLSVEKNKIRSNLISIFEKIERG